MHNLDLYSDYQKITVFTQNSLSSGSINNKRAENNREQRKRASQCPEAHDGQGKQPEIESARWKGSAHFRLFNFENSVVFHKRRYHNVKKSGS